MKPSEAMALQGKFLAEASAMDDGSVLYIICHRLAIDLDHYTHLKRKQWKITVVKQKKKKK